MSQEHPAIGDRFRDNKGRVVEVVGTGQWQGGAKVRNEATGRHSEIKKRYLKGWTLVVDQSPQIIYANEMPVSRGEFDVLVARVEALESLSVGGSR